MLGYHAEFVSFYPKEEKSMLFTKNDQGLPRASISSVCIPSGPLWPGWKLYAAVGCLVRGGGWVWTGWFCPRAPQDSMGRLFQLYYFTSSTDFPAQANPVTRLTGGGRRMIVVSHPRMCSLEEQNLLHGSNTMRWGTLHQFWSLQRWVGRGDWRCHWISEWVPFGFWSACSSCRAVCNWGHQLDLMHCMYSTWQLTLGYLSGYVFVCASIRACLCEGVSMCACSGRQECMWRPEVNISCLLQCSTLFFWDRLSHWIWSSLTQLAWRTREFQGPSYLHLQPSSGVREVYLLC